MSSFGLDLEISSWVSPLDLQPPFGSVSRERVAERVDLLSETSIALPTPVALFNEVPEMSNFLYIDSQGSGAPAGRSNAQIQLSVPAPLALPQFPMTPITPTTPIIPTSGITPPQPPEVTVIDPQQESYESSIIFNQHQDSEASRDKSDSAYEGEGSDTDYTETESSAMDVQPPNEDLSDVVKGVKLGTSKSPVIEAFVYCALKGWGVQIKRCTRHEVEFLVTDFDYYYNCSNRICSKQRPTEDISARIKGLKRWFPDFPARKAQISGTFSVSVGKGNNKIHKIRKIMNKNRELIGICKLRRSR